MSGVFLVDTDATLGLTHSSVGQEFLKRSQDLSIADGVYEEITGSRQEDIETRRMARKAESLINQNDNATIEEADLIEDNKNLGFGEQSIQNVIHADTPDVQVVYFFDSDVFHIIPNVSNDVEFHVVTRILTFDYWDLSTSEQLKHAMKIASGRDWTSSLNLYDLTVKAKIIPERLYDEDKLRGVLKRVESDL